MPIHHRILAAIAVTLAAAPAHGQSLAQGQVPSGEGDAPPPGGTGVSSLRDEGVLCVFDPTARRKLREARILAQPATGDTFVAVRYSARPLPLGLLYPARRSYATSRPWFGSGAPLVFAGRTYEKHGAPVALPIGEMRPVGTTADVWLFERKPAAEPDVLYTPSGPGCEFQPYRTTTAPVRGARASRGVPPRHRVLGYMTDRTPSGDPRPARHFSAVQGRQLEQGLADMVITPRHRIGRIESRPFPFGGGSDTLSHIVLLRLQDPGERAAGGRALLYVHGYRNTFEAAARRAAQLAEDLDFDGDVYFFSWPSRARISAYGIDVTALERSRRALAESVGRLLDAYGDGNVSVIAHSLGTRGFARAVADLQPARPGKLFDHVVLASPDQDFVVFRDYDIGPVVTAANHVTVYSSPADRALFVSRLFVGGRRAGEDPLNVAEIRGIDVIDTSSSTSGFLGHSDFAESPAALGDLYLLLRGRTPEQRALTRVENDGRGYWTFR